MLTLLALHAVMAPQIVAKDVDYKDGDVTCQGYVAYPKNLKANVPAVMVVHQWTGLSDYEKGRARQLAELGYVAFACDIYGKGVRAGVNGAQAGQLAGKYRNADRKLFRERLLAGYHAMLAQSHVDKARTAVIGYCFGGTGALELARTGAPVKAAVCFHGGLDSTNKADGAKIKGKILVLHGTEDHSSSPEKIAAMEDEFKSHHVDYQMVWYKGAVHGFTQPMAGNDPSRGMAYNAEADKNSWALMTDLFRKVFKK
ncbi:MAG: dienelactone hydrolase family protein [Fimbriimonadaceae bacterium]|nr:dienelactone hydrolase family protein [Fimbriimonadaceae bacterium]